jgi:hypothetical protein
MSFLLPYIMCVIYNTNFNVNDGMHVYGFD